MTSHATEPAQLDASFFRRLFESAGLPVFACDREGRILAWNPRGEEVMRVRSADPAQPHVRDILPAELHSELDVGLKQLVETGQPLEFRTRIVRRDGKAVEYACWLTPIYDEEHRLECVSVWLNDITARLQLRRSMRKRERLTALGAMAGSVAHHYNNFLCSIATSLDFALNMNTISAMRRTLRRTADAVSRATHLTQQLLAFAQADHRLQETGDLAEIVREFYECHRANLTAQGIDVVTHFDRVPYVPLPREQITIVIENLTRNATEAMHAGGTLTVALRRKGEGAVALTVADTGPGISAEDKNGARLRAVLHHEG